MKNEKKNRKSPVATTAHIYILLDRSGSMASIAADVIGGFNTFLDEQRAAGPNARITLVQFDSQDAHEVILNGAPIAEATHLNTSIFSPRGGTPLLDATARLIGLADAAATARQNAGLPAEQVVFVSITDGEENCSATYTLPQVRALIDERSRQGWLFVFLSAALDAYGEAGSMGVHRANTRTFSHDSEGAVMAMASISHNMLRLRREFAADRAVPSFFEEEDESTGDKQ
jgi:Mg-chelatase subunit ChlD